MKAPRKWLAALRGRFPLLRKELTEQAARTRTYVVRLLYALTLFVIFCLLFRQHIQAAGGRPEAMTGWGADVFKQIVYIQFGAIYIFLPAIMSGALTIEKERDSLALLFLTDLRPWEITLEKYLGRLIPMFTFIMLSLPLTGLAYSMGGVDSRMIVNAVFLLLAACMQVGAAALMFSAYCRSTVASLLSAYLVAVPICSVPPFSALFFFAEMAGQSPVIVGLSSIGIIASIACFLALAKRFLVQRAFLPPVNLTLNFFRRLDAFWQYMNQFAGGVVLIKDKSTLPEYQPVFWRETAKKSLGKLNYLFRVLVAIEAPILFVAVAMSMLGMRYDQHDIAGLSWMLFALWGAAALAVAIRSADVVAVERSNQTLEVLLTTPLRTADILRQKMQAVWRLILVFWVPLASLVLMEASFETAMDTAGGLGTLGYLFFSFLAIFIYLPMFAWMSLWIGLRVTSRVRAIILSIAALVFWCALPAAILQLLELTGLYTWSSGSPESSADRLFMMASPASAIVLAEIGRSTVFFRNEPVHLLLVLNFIFYGGLLIGFRHLCLTRADQYMRRYRQTAQAESEEELLREEAQAQ